MPQRIPPQIDLQILTMLAEGYTNKQIASNLSVSASYVSKVKNGKKSSYAHVAWPISNKDDMLNNYIDLSDEDLINYINTQIEHCQMQIHIYQLIIRRINNNATKS